MFSGCRNSSHFIIVRVNPVMRGIGTFNKQLEFIPVGNGIEFIADFKDPDRAFYQIAAIQSVIPYVIELI